MIRIVAFQPDIAQNLGNMIRTCACFNIPISVIEPCGFPFSIKALRRSAMDYADIAHIDHHTDWDAFYREISGRCVLLTTKSQQSYTDFQFLPNDNLILGQESAGVPDHIVSECHETITIPMPGGGRSLNVSTSAAIVASEAIRQLQHSD